MANQPTPPALIDEEKALFQTHMPEDLAEIVSQGIKRRHFLKLLAITVGGFLAAQLLDGHGLLALSPVETVAAASLENAVKVSMRINGAKKSLEVDSRMTLLDALRERLGLTGSKKGCDHGLRASAAVRIRLSADDKVHVMCAAQDIGTGTYTIMAQTAADALGLPVENVTVEIGDSSLPPGPMSAGSNTAATVTPAVMAAAEQLRNDLLQLAADGGSDLKGVAADAVDYGEGKLYLKSDASKSATYRSILRRAKKETMEACVSTKPLQDGHLGPRTPPCTPAAIPAEANADGGKYSFHSFGAQFVEVWVDEDIGTVRVKRITSVHDVGRVLNEKTARSQVIGGLIYHMGHALMEETVFDDRWGAPATRTFADYHVPVQLDVPPIDVHFIGKPDPHISPIGVRGVGEIAGVGIAAAIANAVFNATGKRVRDLPITLDKVMG